MKKNNANREIKYMSFLNLKNSVVLVEVIYVGRVIFYTLCFAHLLHCVFIILYLYYFWFYWKINKLLRKATTFLLLNKRKHFHISFPVNYNNNCDYFYWKEKYIITCLPTPILHILTIHNYSYAISLCFLLEIQELKLHLCDNSVYSIIT